MDELSLVIAEEPLVDDVSADVEVPVLDSDGLPVVGDDADPTDEGFDWDDGTIDDGSATLDDGIVDDGGVIDDGGSGDDVVIGGDASGDVPVAVDDSWAYIDLYVPEDNVEGDGDQAEDTFVWICLYPEETSLDTEQLGRPMFEDKGLADNTDTSTEVPFDAAICVCFPCDAIA